MTRDFTKAQFAKALKAHGFKQVMMWLQDTSGETTASYGMVWDTQKKKFLRRASLAHAIKSRKRNGDAA